MPSFDVEKIIETRVFPAGSVVVPLAQPAGRVILNLLEPEAPDSLARWGFFNAIFEEKEYGEHYVLETLAREMMARRSRARAASSNRSSRPMQNSPPVLQSVCGFFTNVRPTGIHK